jgi:hypothetical protein
MIPISGDVYLLTLNDRKRHEHITARGRVIRFLVP